MRLLFMPFYPSFLKSRKGTKNIVLMQAFYEKVYFCKIIFHSIGKKLQFLHYSIFFCTFAEIYVCVRNAP